MHCWFGYVRCAEEAAVNVFVIQTRIKHVFAQSLSGCSKFCFSFNRIENTYGKNTIDFNIFFPFNLLFTSESISLFLSITLPFRAAVDFYCHCVLYVVGR